MKKNIHKIPKDVYEKIKTIGGNAVVVGCAVKFKADDLVFGRLSHLGIVLDDGGLKLPTSMIPLKNQGKYSERNINGLEIIRKDLPKETHYNSVESPNWGDSYNGTHTVNLSYKKFPREFRPPRELEIFITCNDVRPNLPIYVITFQVREVLNQKEKDFKIKLLENLNLLQENIGTCGVEASSTALSDYIKSLHVSWEILPPGTLEETINRLFYEKNPTIQQKNVTEERYKFFLNLKPKNLVYGQSGFRRYFGALLEDNLVIFENIEYGNAVYILFDNWESLSKLSRVDLLSGMFGDSFERIIHTKKWKDKIRDIVTKRRKMNGSGKIIKKAVRGKLKPNLSR